MYTLLVCVHAKLLESFLTPCDTMDCSTPGSSVHGILQARMLEWVANPWGFPNPGIKPVSLMSPALAGEFFTTSATWEAQFICIFYIYIYDYAVLSRSVVSDSAIPWAGVRQASLSMGLFRQEYWSVLPFPPPGDLPDPGIELASPALASEYHWATFSNFICWISRFESISILQVQSWRNTVSREITVVLWSVLASCCCCNKGLYTSWLNTDLFS